MKLVHAQAVYSFILNEDEWYSATEQQQQAWVAQIMREGQETDARYLTILVEPDAVMSISPEPKRHKVWGYTVPISVEDAFQIALIDILAKYVALNKLTYARARGIAKQVFEL